MTEVCPVSEKRINERIARLNAIFTFSLMAIFIIASFQWLVIFLAIDFFIRGFFNVRYSPLKLVSQYFIDTIGIQPKYINAGPKIFAARIGFLLTLLSGIFIIWDFVLLGQITAGILVFFSFLEGVFGYCVACKIYPLIYKHA